MDTSRPTPSRGPHAPSTSAGVVVILVLFALCTWFAITQPAPPVRTDWSSGSAFWQPQERNAFLRLARTGMVSSMTFTPDGQRGWAIVLPNSLITTSDAGRSWSLASHDLFGFDTLALTADGRQGWAAGPLRLSHSVDGGRHWTRADDPLLPGKWWKSLAFDPDGRNGVLVDMTGALASTDDGGNTWRVPQKLKQVGPGRIGKFMAATWRRDGESGWVVGAGGRVVRISKGGSYWFDITNAIPAATTLTRVQFLQDGERGWVVGSNGELFASTDGGRRWHPVAVVPGSTFVDVRFAEDAQRGWALAKDSAVFATLDGGATWIRRSEPAQWHRSALAVSADGARIMVSGVWGIKISDDGGATWQAPVRDALNNLAALAFGADGVRGWAVGEGGTVIRTVDSGASWVAQNPGTQAHLNAVAVAADGLRALAAGDGGTLLRTTDGGAHWTKLALGSAENVRRLVLSADGARGLVMGGQGTIWLTGDGGRSWHRPRAGFAAQTLDDVSTRDDGKTVWVVARSGDMYHSIDGGDTWQAAAWADFPGGAAWQASGATDLPAFGRDGKRAWLNRAERDGCRLERIAPEAEPGEASPAPPGKEYCGTLVAAFQSDAKTGWAISQGNVLHVTHDAGATWQSPLAGYRRLPGLWYWVALLLLAGGMLLALRTRRVSADATGAVNMFADDDAITDFDDDRLEFGPLARGLSRFLRNPRTSPPLTLSITGDWGAGKSSLMRLLCADLRRYGQRPIWFNAWHHQKDEQLFAALLGTIQAQAAPSSWRPAGWMFRVKLLWIRSKRHVLVSFLVLALITLLLTVQVQHPLAWPDLVALVQALPRVFSDPRALTPGDIGQHVTAVAPFLALVPVARSFYNGMKAFRGEPALMFKGLSDKLSLKQASAQNTFRGTFARQFEEVASALPYRMTIVVDDLDRCRPENILEVLETVNFLTASGQCFVVFGMATERVEAALRMAFEKVAAEMDALQEEDAGDAGQIDPAARAKQRRRVYARDYLEKLINLEIKVPQRSGIGADALFTARVARGIAPLRRAGLAVAAYWPLWLAALAICVGILAGEHWAWPALPVHVVAIAPAAPTADAAPVAVAAPLLSARQEEDMRKLDSSFTEGDPGAWLAQYGPPAAAAAFLLALAVIHGLLRVRAEAVEVQDSAAFRHGLKIWTELAASRRSTPRTIKRWGNRLRYFAMLQQGVAIEESRWQHVMRALRRRLAASRRLARFLSRFVVPTPAPPPPAAAPTIIEEGRLIAIGAAHEVYQSGWRTALDGGAAGHGAQLVSQTIARYAEVTGTPWRAISDDEARAFERLLAGIKLPAPQGAAGT